ncbi:hypothetical protein ACFV0H_31510 [Streptomyces erythrochromogenes]|uniref:hypothetical protein n=1 Tax=Streptomyces erythrochromogenes TaxID=285574 RepID=UPI0036790E82
MPLPAWNDPALKGGTMVRGALWLVQEIREGNTFTKEQIRVAFPRIAQADRRIRDLREFGWVIHPSTEDGSLAAEQLRFVKAGVPVWDPVARGAAKRKKLSAKEVREAMERDDFMCTVCGITGAEPYADDIDETAVLLVSRREVTLPGGDRETLPVTECKRCRAGGDGSPVDTARLIEEIGGLGEADRERLLRWVGQGKRDTVALERAWSAYRRLPAQARADVQRALEG